MLYPILGIVVFILDIIAIVSVLSGRSSVERKILWVVIILLLPFIGMILYFLLGRSSADA
ncbi:MAG TPA: PLDc N-terminal domain-containing protein [Tepidisphaeraceae bacterium]|nr:PLDc N-terminal domain-containing protein [Tepidisphaeraceae bacterium]